MISGTSAQSAGGSFFRTSRIKERTVGTSSRPSRSGEDITRAVKRAPLDILSTRSQRTAGLGDVSDGHGRAQRTRDRTWSDRCAFQRTILPFMVQPLNLPKVVVDNCTPGQ